MKIVGLHYMILSAVHTLCNCLSFRNCETTKIAR